MDRRRFTEDEIIAEVFAPLAGAEGLGLRDDAALVSLRAGADLVVTTDALVAGVHFFADDPPALVARKALRVNLSDLAAKGAEPLGFLLSLSLPRDWTNGWLAQFAAGLAEDARCFSCPLLGGDTTATPGPLSISITALGRAARFVPRSGARPGDAIFVSGTIGDAALGLALRKGAAFGDRLDAAARDHLIDRYLLPRPRTALIGPLREFASAAMDVSDGLAGDLAKLLRASGASGAVEVSRAPFSPAARQAIEIDPRLVDLALTGGDDYEILCCAPPEAETALEQAARDVGAQLTKIGAACAGRAPPSFLDADGSTRNFSKLSFSHF
jgi:thiamine-monophosphate kinase